MVLLRLPEINVPETIIALNITTEKSATEIYAVDEATGLLS